MQDQRSPQIHSDWVNQAVQSRSQDTFERILEVTQKLLKERPFREISVAEIAKAANASPPSLYARVQNKQALLGVLFERYAVQKKALVEQLFEPNRWRNVSLATALHQTFPVMVDAYRAQQGLIRAFLEQASEDSRFRRDWSKVGEFIVEKISQFALLRVSEIGHPHPRQAIAFTLSVSFASIAHRIQMHKIDQPQEVAFNRELVSMMLQYLRIVDVPDDLQANDSPLQELQ